MRRGVTEIAYSLAPLKLIYATVIDHDGWQLFSLIDKCLAHGLHSHKRPSGFASQCLKSDALPTMWKDGENLENVTRCFAHYALPILLDSLLAFAVLAVLAFLRRIA